MLDYLAQLPGRIYYAWVKRFETQIGYRIDLKNLEPNWINGVMVFDMSSVWRKRHIKARGINYYTIGEVKNGLSTRFDYTSPYYQSWLGGYTVQFVRNREWTATDHFHLGEADQINWLEMYGDKTPLADIPMDIFKEIKKINISGFKGKLYEGGGWSHTDVGSNTNGLTLAILMAACAHIFNISNRKLALKERNFIPHWNKNLPTDSYHQVKLWGYVAILELDSKTKAVLYANAAGFDDKLGNKYDYFKQIGSDLQKTLLSSEIVKV